MSKKRKNRKRKVYYQTSCKHRIKRGNFILLVKIIPLLLLLKVKSNQIKKKNKQAKCNRISEINCYSIAVTFIVGS